MIVREHLLFRVMERVLGPDHRDLTPFMHDLAKTYYDGAEYTEAEQLYRRILSIREKLLKGTMGSESQWAGSFLYSTIFNLGEICRVQGKDEEARRLSQRLITFLKTCLAENDLQLNATMQDMTSLDSTFRSLRAAGEGLGHIFGEKPTSHGLLADRFDYGDRFIGPHAYIRLFGIWTRRGSNPHRIFAVIDYLVLGLYAWTYIFWSLKSLSPLEAAAELSGAVLSICGWLGFTCSNSLHEWAVFLTVAVGIIYFYRAIKYFYVSSRTEAYIERATQKYRGL